MNLFLFLSLAALALTSVPALLWGINLFCFHRPGNRAPGPSPDRNRRPGVSVLIPARNEADRIEETLLRVLNSSGVNLEVLVYDDQSEDRTADIVRAFAHGDDRVELIEGPPLPENWSGKQYACWQLARAARHDIFCFLDADVRLEGPEALRQVVDELGRNPARLISGFPRQITETLGEKLLISFIQYILLAFLPIPLMRRTTSPALSAGCGQLMVAERAAYMEAGGHRAIRRSRHDGITLPAAFRRQGFPTDLFDASGLARVRMYDGLRTAWEGLAKNATEGMARPFVLPVFTLFLLGGQVLPFLLLAAAPFSAVGATPPAVASAAVLLAYLPRITGVFRFRQSLLGAILHPAGVMLLLGNQWYAFVRNLAGGRVEWKGRSYADPNPDA